MGEGIGTTKEPEYSWPDLLDRVAQLKEERDRLKEELEASHACERQLQDELHEAIMGRRVKSDSLY